jgi:hypothetical protein
MVIERFLAPDLWRRSQGQEKRLERNYNNDKSENYGIWEAALCHHIVGSFIRRKLIIFR